MKDIKRYRNKYFSILSDSISTLEGYSEPKGAEYYATAYKMFTGVHTFSNTWWGQVIERLEGKLLVNNSISGSAVCWHPAYEIPSYGCSDERTSALDKDGVAPDVIMVFLGTNDWGVGTQVTSVRPSKDDENNLALFSSAYAKMLEKLQKRYPNAEIWCFTLLVERYTTRENFELSGTSRRKDFSKRSVAG